MPNVMAALPNIGGVLCSTPQSYWLTPTTRVLCSNAAKTRNPLKFAEVPQTRQQISAVSGPKFTILWGHVEEVLLFNKFFPIVGTCLSCEDTAGQSCAMVPRWRFFCVLYLQRAATHQLTNVTETHEKSLWKRIKIVRKMHALVYVCVLLSDGYDTIAAVQVYRHHARCTGI